MKAELQAAAAAVLQVCFKVTVDPRDVLPIIAIRGRVATFAVGEANPDGSGVGLIVALGDGLARLVPMQDYLPTGEELQAAVPIGLLARLDAAWQWPGAEDILPT